jgi:gallate decarboxylase subunit D
VLRREGMGMITHDRAGGESPGVRFHNFSGVKGRFEVVALVYELDIDCLVILYGGTRPHIGAVGLGQVRPSLKDPEAISATSSVFTYVGHKEDVVAKAVSEELTRRLGRNTVVVAGIHWDGLTEEDIGTIRDVCRTLTDEIVNELTL